jgi:hypothetical protein
MKYKKFLQKVLDIGLKSQTELTFGKGSFIKISNMTYIRSKKAYLVNVTLHFDDFENSMDLYPDGLEYIVKSAWDVLGVGNPIIIQSSVDVIPK